MAGGGGQNAYDASAAGMRQAAKTAATVGDVTAGPLVTGQRVNRYMNPYTQSVIDTTMGSMDRARDMAINDIGASATAAGAYGGSRHGVAEAETNRAFIDQVGQMSAGLNAQNFGQAQAQANTDLDRRTGVRLANQSAELQGAGLLSGIAGQTFNQAQDVNSDMMQAGLMQQAMRQSMIDAAKAQFAGYTGAPGQSLTYPLAAIGGVPSPQTQTTSQQPGLLNYLSLGMGF